MKLKNLMSEAHFGCPVEYGNDEVSSVVSDSRKIKSGCVFVCIEGIHCDGHSFVQEALDEGAVAVIVKKGRTPLLASARVIEAEDTRKALSYLLDAFYLHPARDMRLVGVTGTNGKTSLTHLLKAIFEAAGRKCGLIGTLGSYLDKERIEVSCADSLANMTTPDPEELYRVLDAMRIGGAEYVFMEASSHALYYEKLAPLKFECAVFTNLTAEHLDFHATMEDYLGAKLKLFENSRLTVINFDSPYYDAVKEKCRSYVSCSAASKAADYFAKAASISLLDGTEYILENKKESFAVSNSLVGDFNVMNTLQAIAVAMEMGIDAGVIKSALKNFGGVSGRLERVRFDADKECTVFIDYVHTPDALENVLLTLKKTRKNNERITLLFGCGGDRDRNKRSEMGRIGTTLADFAIITSDNCRGETRGAIFSDILEGVGNAKNYVVVPDRRDALRLAAKFATCGDTVLLAGKGHEKYEMIGNERLPFDEYEIIKEFIANDERKRHNEDTSG